VYVDHFADGVSARGNPIAPVDYEWLQWSNYRRTLEEWRALQE
jgi:hypothetical protein